MHTDAFFRFFKMSVKNIFCILITTTCECDTNFIKRFYALPYLRKVINRIKNFFITLKKKTAFKTFYLYILMQDRITEFVSVTAFIKIIAVSR